MEIPRRPWAILAGGVVAVFSGALLVMWWSGVPELVRFAAWRGKTNTCCIGLLLGATALGLRGTGHPGAHRVAGVLAAAMTILGAATLVEYVAEVDLGIDQLLARVWPFAESASYPNRIWPSSALSFVLLGAVLALADRRRGATLAKLGQAVALALIALDCAALIGYLYNATFLYRDGAFIRMSPSTALCFTLLAAGSFALRPEIGVVRQLAGEGIGAYLARRLLAPLVVLPIVLGWVRIGGEDLGWWNETVSAPLEVIAYICVLAVFVRYIARSLDAVDARRKRSEQELRRASELTAALAQARTVEEVAKAMIELGVPALGADAGRVFMLDPADACLRLVASTGCPAQAAEPFRTLSLHAALPVCEAVRDRAPVYCKSLDDLHARYPKLTELRPETRALAAIPLEGRERTLGAVALTFRESLPDEQARMRLDHLTWQCGQALDRAVLFDSERAARRAAGAANRAKDEFLAMLGHELRNPLAPITSALDLMRHRDHRPNREREVIERQVRHMTRLVDDLLDVSRITDGKVDLARTCLDISGVLDDAVELVRPLFDEREQVLTVDIEPGLVVDGDRARLVQIVSNLLVNAAKYTPPGGKIELVAGRREAAIVIQVTDNGAGIPPALLPRIFELFVQGERTFDRAMGGLGLGLAIVHSLVTLHGGVITAASDGEGKGATFTVILPAMDPPRVAEAPALPRPIQATSAHRVLVVDDNTDAAELMSEALELAGHTVRIAYDGESALEVARELDPECVMLDIGLPVMDGFEVARRLRDRDGDRRRLLVAVTGYGQKEDVRRAFEAGFDRHLVKPVSLDTVLEIVANSRAVAKP
jgi:signal transduction histidine kinase/CheY-like chemotaxis protein